MSPSASSRHFTGIHHYEGEAYGPFGFLNPTSRKQPLPARKAEQQSSQEDVLKNGNGQQKAVKEAPENKDEIRASDVYRKWRSRDNRKGNFHLPSARRGITIANTSSVLRSARHHCH